MSETTSDHVAVELTQDEARLVIAALRQFEPYWPSDMDELSRVELMHGIRTAIGHITTTLSA
jgi:hypothetical protein